MEGGQLMHLEPFELHRPSSIEEFVALSAGLEPGAYDVIAGGTDLLPNYKMGLNLRPHLVALWDIEELRGMDLGRLGAMTRLSEIEADGSFASAFPGIAAAARQVATPLVRSTATVGGNLLLETRCFFFNQSRPWRASLGFCLKAEGDRCHVVPQTERCYATFSGDLAPALAVVGGEVELVGSKGRRRLPVLDLYDAGGDGIRRLRLLPGEIVAAVHLPEASRGIPATYSKLRIRPSFDFPELGVAVALVQDQGRVAYLRVAVGGVESRPCAFDDLTAPLMGAPWSDRLATELGEGIQSAVRPVHNTSLPPDYRKHMVSVLVRRALREVAHMPAPMSGATHAPGS